MIYFVCSLNKETEVESESSKTDLKPIKRPTRTKAAKVSSSIFVVWEAVFSRLYATLSPDVKKHRYQNAFLHFIIVK